MGSSIGLGKSVAATVARAIAVPVPKAQSPGFQGLHGLSQKKDPFECWPASSVARRLLLFEQ
jgi:hypothetical protein